MKRHVEHVGQQILIGLLTRQQLAERWRCCGHTIARRKDLQPVRLGRRLLRYRLSDVEAIEAAAVCRKQRKNSRHSDTIVTSRAFSRQLQKLRRCFCLWLLLAGLLIDRSDRNRLEITLSLRLEWEVVQHFGSPALPRVAPGRTLSLQGNEVADVPANIGE